MYVSSEVSSFMLNLFRIRPIVAGEFILQAIRQYLCHHHFYQLSGYIVPSSGDNILTYAIYFFYIVFPGYIVLFVSNSERALYTIF